jgi:hypothetical protein
MAVQVRYEKRRGFQPPWYTVKIYRCECGHESTSRVNWHGPTPRGGFYCPKCGTIITI